MRQLLRRAWYLLRHRQLERDLSEELDFHRDMKQRELEDEGLKPTDAAIASRRALGSTALARDHAHDVWVPLWLQGVGQDLRLAVRTLRATPLVTTVAVLTLALGIGANTAIFSLVNGLLLRTLPVKEPTRLVLVKGREPVGFPEWSYPLWEEFRARPWLFDGTIAWTPTARANLAGGPESQPIDGLLASGSFFETLGVPAFLGRTFSETDDQRGGAPAGPVTVISYRFWLRHFGGAVDAIGRTLPIDNVPFTVVGITPPSFFGPDVGRTFDFIVPLGAEPLLSRTDTRLDDRTATWLNIMARLRSGETPEDATARLRGVQSQMLKATVPLNWPTQILEQYLQQQFRLVSAATGDSTVRGRYTRPLLTILIVAALVLLIACANLANLLLARATARRHEFSVRASLGASRWRLVRQQLSESALLASAGAAGGLIVAVWGSRVLVRQLSTDISPLFLDLSPDWHVLLFTTGMALTTASLFGVGPAFQGSSGALIDAMNRRGATAENDAGGRVGFSGSFVVAQVAVSVMLLVAAGLFVRTFVSLTTRPLGFDRDRLLVVTMNTHAASIDPSQRLPLYDRARDRVRALPGVADAAVSVLTPPVTGPMPVLPMAEVASVRLADHPSASASAINVVTPGWFHTFGTPVVAGRDLADLDRAGGPRVAVVNQAFVRKFLGGANPVGRAIIPRWPPPARNSPVEIVGVAADAVYGSLRYPMQPTIYVSLAQADFLPSPWLWQVNLTIRSNSGSPMGLSRSVATALGTVNSAMSLTFRPLAEQVDASVAQERMIAKLAGSFGALGLLMAGLGLYGVTAYAVSRRRQEVGIRMALGAAPAGVVRLVLSRVLLLVGIGVIVGMGVSLWATRFVATLLYGLEPRDPATLVGAIVVLAGVGALAGFLPAWRASRIDPAVVLRES